MFSFLLGLCIALYLSGFFYLWRRRKAGLTTSTWREEAPFLALMAAAGAVLLFSLRFQ